MKLFRFKSDRFWVKPDGTRLLQKDAPGSLLVVPNEDDINGATAQDASNCMYARYIRRVHGSSVVFIKRDVAYAEMPNEEGELCLMRFILSAPAKQKIKEFDGGKKLPKHSVLFAKPAGSRTMEAQALAQALWQLKKQKAASKPKTGAIPVAKPASSKATFKKQKAHVVGSKILSNQIDSDVKTLRRSGKGMFQFKPAVGPA